MEKFFANKLGRQAQGSGGNVDDTDAIFFETKYQVPKDRSQKVTYGRVVDYRTQKEEPHRLRLIVGVSLICYSGDVSTHVADITTANIFINGTISTAGARYMLCDI